MVKYAVRVVSKMSSSKVEISKLKESKDWTIWKMQVRVVLKSMGIFKVVDGTEKYPTLKEGSSTSDTTLYDAAVEAWDTKDVKAQSVILTSIDAQPSLHVVNCKTAGGMWTKLHGVYEQKSETGIHLLYQRLLTFRKSEDDDMTNFISKLEEIVHQLKDLGETISDKMVTTIILLALPPEFNHFHSAWESTAEDKRKIDRIVKSIND